MVARWVGRQEYGTRFGVWIEGVGMCEDIKVEHKGLGLYGSMKEGERD